VTDVKFRSKTSLYWNSTSFIIILNR